MALKNYGVLVGRIVDRRVATTSNPHYQMHVIDSDHDYRIAIDVRSKIAASAIAFFVDEHFQHDITHKLAGLSLGFHPLKRTPTSGALDFIRGNLFDWKDMRPLPTEASGVDNDVEEKITHYVQRTMGDASALIYAFGAAWGPEDKKDQLFGFKPGYGLHDMHMNQGNSRDGAFVADNGAWQDGGLLFHYPSESRWVAVFLKFQSQAWHTNDQTGDPVTSVAPIEPHEPTQPREGNPDWSMYIVAALVNDTRLEEIETVTLLNPGPVPIDLAGWSLADKNKNKHPLSGVVDPGESVRIVVQKPMELSNKGGIITLLNEEGLKVHGVSYTKAQAQNPGWTVVFGA